VNGELPKGWVWTSLENMTDIVLGQSPPSSTYNEDKFGLPFYQGKSEFGLIYPIPTKWCSSPKKIAEEGDILISVRAPVGPTNICPKKSCIGRGLAAIRGLGNINNKFILYLLRNSEEQFRNKATGTTFEAITGNVLRNFEVPLPPLAEQQRIVNKIEELFTNLDKGIESLEQVKYKLKIYRQAILKYAMEGKLTEKWREENKDKIDFFSYKSEESNDKLPKNWVWTSLENIVDILDNRRIPINAEEREKRINNKDESQLYPYYGSTGQVGWIDEYIFDEELILLGEDGAPFLDFIKDKAYLINGKSWVNNHAHVLRAIKDISVNPFICYYLNSFDYRKYITGTTRYKLNQSQMKKIIVPLPPLEEQHKIVEHIEQLFSLADYIEETVGSKLEQSKTLRQSILKKAFEGKLVPQDPNDEPAELLLEKIKKQRLNKEELVQEKLV